MSELYIGLMSGTSLDGIDAVLVDFENPSPQLLSSFSQQIPAPLKSSIQQLCDAQATTNEINLMGAIDRQLGKLFATAVIALYQQAGVTPQQITAIGSHGQTIRHYPLGQQGFTLQIGDANTIAVETQIDVVADFRKKDVALGGQGAPLVPAFHDAVFADKNSDRMIVNIGGMANLTFLPAHADNAIIGYDTGPGNTLIDKWIQQQNNQPYDVDGQWARSGQLDEALLARMLEDDYFAQPAPKSTGREKFNLDWLAAFITPTMAPQDVQHTLVHLTAKSLANEVSQITDSGEIYLCGGGSHNGFLLATIAFYLPEFTVLNTHALGVNPDWVEAMAFAWLARAYVQRQPGNVPSVTGAQRSAVLGSFYPKD
jgi:anhydro-N-acetylmuramic acid kinase